MKNMYLFINRKKITYTTYHLILAKIHMVTKPQIHHIIYLKTNKSLNINY